MDILKEKALEIIARHCEEQQSAAYEELVCNELFGDFNSKTEPIIKELLKSMADDNLIDINGDRICIKHSSQKPSCDILVLYKSPDDLKDIISKEDVFYDSATVDVGHGCNVEATCLFCEALRILPQLMPLLIDAGVGLGQIIKAYNGYKDVYSLISNIFKKDKNSGSDEEIRLSDDILTSVAMTKIFDKYDIDIQKLTKVKLIHHNKTKIGALGLYAVNNEGYNEAQLEGSPDSIHYFTFEFTGSSLPGDYLLATCEILSNGEERYISLTPITIDDNISNLTQLI